MKKWLLIFAVALLFSCEEIKVNKTSSDTFYTEEKSQINWKEVDEYPAFDACKEQTDKYAAKCCFEKKVAEYIYAQLGRSEWEVEEAIEDTVLLQLVISESGKPQIKNFQVDSLTNLYIPDLQERLQQGIDSLPKIYPASKRGIPVATLFKLPIIISAE